GIVPYTFEVVAKDAAATGDGRTIPLEYRLKVSLPIRPFGIDPGNPDLQQGPQSAVASFAQPTPSPLPTCTPTSSPFVLASSTADEETVALTQEIGDEYKDYLNPSTLEITDVSKMITGTLGTDPAVTFKKGDYVAMHVIRWKELSKEGKSDPA